MDRGHPLAVDGDPARQPLEALRSRPQVSLDVPESREARPREHPGVDEPAQLTRDVLPRGAEDGGRRERVEPLADGSRRLEDLTEPDERVERRGPEVPADVLTQRRKGLGVPRGAATTRDERVQRCAGGIVDRRFETAVRRGDESEGQLRPELATSPNGPARAR